MSRRTITFPDSAASPRVDTIVRMGDDSMSRLSEFRTGMVLVGSGDVCHIRVIDRYLSYQQFAFVRNGGRWSIAHVPSAKNPTLLNGVPVRIDTQLWEGAVIRCGTTVWVTAGEEFRGTWYIAARNIEEFYISSLLVYGSARKAAEHIGVDQRTYLRHIHENPEADRILRQQIAMRKGRSHGSPGYPFGVPVVGVSTSTQG